MTLQELEQFSHANIETIDRTALTNVEEIRIDGSLPAAQRMLKYLDEVKNPYCFLCGETPVKICFSPDDTDLETKMKHYFLHLKE